VQQPPERRKHQLQEAITMRNMPLIALCLIATAFAAPAAQAASIVLTPSSPSFAVGETLQVDVVGKDLFAGQPLGDELVGFGFDATVTPNGIAALTGLALTPGLATPFTDLGTLAQVVALAGLESIRGAASVVLASFELTALSPGMLTLAISADPATQPDQGLAFLSTTLPIGFDNVSVQLAVTAAPLPCTATLLGLGLVALSRRRRA
jgi:hypothetical protein